MQRWRSVVRFRPLLTAEEQGANPMNLNISGETIDMETAQNEPRTFKMDQTFDPTCDQEVMHGDLGTVLVNRLFDGMNSTLIAGA